MSQERKTTPNAPFVWLIQTIHDLCDQGYYGKFEITLEAGRVVHAEKRESLKPPR